MEKKEGRRREWQAPWSLWDPTISIHSHSHQPQLCVSLSSPAPPPIQLCKGPLRLSTTEHHHVLHGWMHTSLGIINWRTDRVRWLTNAQCHLPSRLLCRGGVGWEDVANTKLHLRCLTQITPLIDRLWRRLWKAGLQHSLWGSGWKDTACS